MLRDTEMGDQPTTKWAVMSLRVVVVLTLILTIVLNNLLALLRGRTESRFGHKSVNQALIGRCPPFWSSKIQAATERRAPPSWSWLTEKLRALKLVIRCIQFVELLILYLFNVAIVSAATVTSYDAVYNFLGNYSSCLEMCQRLHILTGNDAISCSGPATNRDDMGWHDNSLFNDGLYS